VSALHSRQLRLRRQRRVRKRVRGTPERPRLNVFRSSRHTYAQLIDDTVGRTLCAASTRESALQGGEASTGSVAAARRVGELVGRRARDLGVAKVVFDRGGYVYHGRVAAVAEGARAAGLEF
jgi:large subunit ribosomal protein L18